MRSRGPPWLPQRGLGLAARNLVLAAIVNNVGLYTTMPKAALAQDLIVNGEVLVPKEEILTGVQAQKLWQQYGQRMKFQCLFCPLPLEPVNVHRETWQHKRRPHFRPYKHKKAEHCRPCEYAGGSHRGAIPTGEFEVAYDQMEIPTKLVKMVRRLSGGVAATSNPSRLISEDENTPSLRHEEYTSHAVEELAHV
jgi:hypothetical protein